jgi:hypothetical protein
MNKRDRKRANETFYTIGRTYYERIPVGLLFGVCKAHGVRPVQEDETEFSGFFCGADGRADIDLRDEDGSDAGSALLIYWHKMESGRYEVTAYIS